MMDFTQEFSDNLVARGRFHLNGDNALMAHYFNPTAIT
jgi:hypothetical protein